MFIVDEQWFISDRFEPNGRVQTDHGFDVEQPTLRKAVPLWSLWYHCGSTVVTVVPPWYGPWYGLWSYGSTVVLVVPLWRSWSLLSHSGVTVVIVVLLWWHCGQCGGTVVSVAPLWAVLRQYCCDTVVILVALC